jgi:hypothetical protein
MSRHFLLFWIVATTGVLVAQDPPARVGRLNYVNGSVSFQPDGVTDWVPATVNRPLTVGDQVYADDGAQAEIHVPGASFRLGSQTAFQFLNLDDSTVQVRLSEGSLNVRVRRLPDGQNFEVDTPTQAFSIQRPGIYRIDTNQDGSETYVTVRDGGGQVTGNAGTFPIAAGQQAVINGQDQAGYNIYAAPGADDFDNWAQTRDRREDHVASSRYVSPDVVGYEDLDQYGSWQSVPNCGQCWAPNNMPADWAPYHDGHWAWVDPWGWSWVDDSPWGFAPFHYGRWTSAEGRWYWAPGPVAVAPVYAPALVAWVGVEGGGFSFGASFGGGGGAVGWFPLGPRDVYVPSYGASQDYVRRVNVSNTTVINNTTIVNVYNEYNRTGTVSTVNYTNRAVRGAVIAVPQNTLTSARPVQQVAVRIQPNQLSAIKAVAPAPRVAPQMASVMGRAPSGSAPHPPAAVLNRAIVAKAAPPPARASFQQRQTELAKNPGRPVTIQQQQQIARTAPAAAVSRPQVHVVAQAKPITPKVNSAPAPHPAGAAMGQRPGGSPPAAQNTPRPGQPAEAARTPQPVARPNQPPAPAQQNRPAVPPAVQERRAEQPPQPNRPNQPPVATPQSRPTVAPGVQERRAEPVQQNRPNQPAAPAPQSRPTTPPAAQERRTEPAPQNRPTTPPAVQERRAEPAPQNRPTTPPAVQERRAEPTPQNRPATPPAVQQRRAEPPVQANRPSEAPRPQPPAQPRPSSPPPQEHRAEPKSIAPPPQEHKPGPPPAHPADEKKKKDEKSH